MAVALGLVSQMVQGGRLEDQGLAAGGAGADHQVVALAHQLQPHGLVQVELITSPVWALTAGQAGLAVSQAGAPPWRASWPGMMISSWMFTVR